MTDSQVQGGVILDAENPWPGLHEFDERGRDFFNGRDEETAALLRLVRDAPLTVLFGRSGLGKTSLLEAGLFPRLRKEQYLPVYVRLDPRNRSAALIEQAAQALRRELDAQGIDHPPFEHAETLWEYLHRNNLELWSLQNHLLTPVLVFDQFEELFTLGAENAEAVRQLRTDLADLIENRIPGPLAQRLEQSEAAASRLSLQAQRYKVLLSFREDYLPEVEGWRRDIPSLMRNRLRLLPMIGDQAFEAVFKTGGRVVDEAVARDIVSFVAAARKELEQAQTRTGADATVPGPAAQPGDSASVEDFAIEPALLSLVCTGLNERRKAAQKPRIDRDLLRTTGRAIVSEFYEDCVKGLPERVRRFIEDELITERGFRNPYPKEDALGQGLTTEPELEGLVKRRLLRVEPQLGIDRIELIHDLLTGVVRDFRDRERQRQQREQNETEEKKRRLQLAFAGVLALIGLGLAGAFFWLWQDARAARERADAALRDAVASKLAIESRGILEGTHAGSDRLGLLFAAAAYRLEAIPETLGALQYGLRATASLLHVLQARDHVIDIIVNSVC